MIASLPTNRAVISGVSALAAVAVICCGITPPRTAKAQTVRADDLKAYPLQHVRVTEVEPKLAALLPPGSDIAADTRGNQVWVRGSSQVQQIAEQIIRSLDSPDQQAPTPSPPAASMPFLKVYTTRNGEAPALAARWVAEYGSTPGVRVVPDGRTSQVLVVAPAEVHTAIAAGQAASRATPSNAAPAAREPIAGLPPGSDGRLAEQRRLVAAPSQPPTQSPAVASREVPLRQTTGGRIEQKLVEMLGRRLSPAPTSIPGAAGYLLQLANGDALALTVDRQRHCVWIQGPDAAVLSCVQLVQLLDNSQESADNVTRAIALSATRPAVVHRAIDAIGASNMQRSAVPGSVTARMPVAGSLVSMFYQQETPPAGEGAGGGATPAQAAGGGSEAALPPRPGTTLEVQPEEGAGLIGPVQIEILEGLDTLVIRGHQRDVQKVIEMIQQIEKLSVETEPSIEVYLLRHVDCQALADLVNQVYTDVFSVRQGTVSVTALVKPNALLVIGREESVAKVLDLVKRLDRPVPPETQFRVFRLQHAAAQTAADTIQAFYQGQQGQQGQQQQAGLQAQVRVTADVRSNSLIVQAAPRDLMEVAAMIARIDTPTSEAVNELRLFTLNNTLAEELAQTLQQAISGAAGPAAGAPTAGGAAARGGAAAGQQQRSTTLRFVTVDVQGKQQLSSGILSDVQITPDARANTLLVSAPAESMPLLEALIRQLDQPPVAESQIKVFTIVNSDAATLVDMLESLFGQPSAAGEPAVRTGAVESETSLVPLRFAVDQRTNSIIASGTVGDLSVVEAVLLRLDETEVRKRKSTVIRLKNAPAADVATAINDYLTNEETVEQVTTDLMNPFEQVDRRVVVVAEPVSNSLIVSATPEYYEEIMALVEKLDERPPMVMIQVLIASVKLNDTDEFGVELGLQDSILFDRSLLGDIVTTTNSTQTPQGNTVVTATEEIIRSATNTPGFLFNNQSLGNSGATDALRHKSAVGSQGLASFDLGRTNNDLGYGGLVLSASSESVSMLLRALKERRRLEVLSRPQIMTMDNQPAFILVGERVPRVTGTSTTEGGFINNTITLEDVGLILGVTPRISPDGLVVMEVDATDSEVGPEAEGIPISIAPNGEAVRSPRIKTIQAQTTVSTADGQTVILGGLITKSNNGVHRRVPLLSDIPVLGDLFRYDFDEGKREELLIILTPHIVENEEDGELVKQAEVARMHWCLSDVLELTGDGSLRGRKDEWRNAETNVIYPDGAPAPGATPLLDNLPESVPAPDQSPFMIERNRNPGKGEAASPNQPDAETNPLRTR